MRPHSANKRARLQHGDEEKGGEKKKEEGESERIRKGEKKKKNVGYARLIFRASEECAEAPLVSPFSVSVPMKRAGEVAGLGFLRSFS